MYLDSISLSKTTPCLAEPGKIIVTGRPSRRLDEVLPYLASLPGVIAYNAPRRPAGSGSRRWAACAGIFSFTYVLAAILTYVMSQGGALVYGATLLFVYALGRGVPILLAGTFTGALKQMQQMGRWSAVIEKASGVLLLGVGLYFLWIA